MNLSQIFDDTIDLAIGHAAGLMKQRNPGPESLGSTFLDPMKWSELKATNWEPFDHPNIKPPAVGYKANIPGKFGLIELSKLEDTTHVSLVDGHETGYLSVSLKGETDIIVPYSTLLVGPADYDWETGETKDETEIIWSVHPGPPVRPSSLKIEAHSVRLITVAEARALGFEWAKLK